MAGYITVATNFARDPRVESVLRQFGNRGLGALLRLWAYVGEQGAEPGMAVNSHGQAIDARTLAKNAGVSVQFLAMLLHECAKSGHISAELWETKAVLCFPGLTKRLQAYHDKKTSTARTQAHRDRIKDAIAARCGNACVRCGSTDALELERIVPKDEGGSNARDNLHLVCLSCARTRRAERQAKVHQIETQNGTDQNAGACRSDLLRSVPFLGSTDSTERESTARAQAGDLPLLGAMPRPKGNPAVLPVATGTLHREHVRCLAPCVRICFPLALAHQLAAQLGGAREVALERLCRFRDEVVAAIPDDQVIGDEPYPFWRAHFAARFPSAAPPRSPVPDRSAPHAGTGRTGAGDKSGFDKLTRRDRDEPRSHTA